MTVLYHHNGETREFSVADRDTFIVSLHAAHGKYCYSTPTRPVAFVLGKKEQELLRGFQAFEQFGDLSTNALLRALKPRARTFRGLPFLFSSEESLCIAVGEDRE